MQALVDNSTLTAVQRLIGDIPVTSMFPVEGDVSAFDQYIQTLLFYDDVAVIDDYKEEFRAERRNRFKEAIFLNPSTIGYGELLAEAQAETEGTYLSITKGNVDSNPMGEFLASLDLHVSPAWYMQSSAWFLKLRLLAEESDVNLPKYGALMTAIFGQLNQNKRSGLRPNWTRSLEDSAGAPIVNRPSKGSDQLGPVNGDVTAFAAGLNWIALRSALYFFSSLKLGSACVLHPIRHSYLAQYIVRKFATSVGPGVREGALDFVSSEASDALEASERILGQGGMELRIPFFAGWAVAKAGNPRAAYDHVLQIRGSKEAVTLRSRFREVEEIAATLDYSRLRTEAAKLRAAIDTDISMLKSRFGGSASADKVGMSVNLLTLAPTVSTTSLSDRLKSLMPSKNRRAVTLLRNMTADLMNIPSLSEVADRFRLSRREEDRAEFFGSLPKVEPKRFRRASSGWKRPL